MIVGISFYYYGLSDHEWPVDEFGKLVRGDIIPLNPEEWMIIAGGLTVLLWSYQAWNEVLQIGDRGFTYLSSFWNLLDITDSIFTIMIVGVIMELITFIPIEIAAVMAAFSSCFKVMKLFDWLRLFEATSFYIHLISETMSDIRPFMVLFFTTLFCFGMPLVMLDLTRDQSDSIVGHTFGFWLPNILLN